MAVRRVTPQEAKALMDEGYVYVDVRSIPEWDEGHPTGSFNVPLNHLGPSGMAPNPDFLAVMEKSFAKDAKRTTPRAPGLLRRPCGRSSVVVRARRSNTSIATAAPSSMKLMCSSVMSRTVSARQATAAS